jgi:Family of unknown function (DUF6090)
MQDEVLKHTRKINKAMKNKKHSFNEKVKEIIIEIFIIVFAVSLSIYLHSWSEHNHQQEEVREFLIDLKSDLNKDVEAMNKETIAMKTSIKNVDAFKKLTIDDLKKIKNLEINFQITNRQTNVGSFEGFKSSGKISYIENKKLKKDILEYYIQNMPPLYKIEDDRNANNMEMIKTISNGSDIVKVMQQPEVKTLMNLSNQYANSLINAYADDVKLAETIIKQIDKELLN